MMWPKNGNFQNTFVSGGPLNRQVSYENTNPHSVVRELNLLGYSDGSIAITAKARDAIKYRPLTQAILSAGFPAPDVSDSILKSIRFGNHNLALISNFIKAIKGVEQTFSEIEEDVCRTLHIDLTQEHAMPTWIKTGNFQNTYSSGGPLNRRVSYANPHPDSIISPLELLGYSDGDIRVHAKISCGEKYRLLTAAITSAGFPAPDFLDRHSNTIMLSFDIATRDRFELLLNTIQPFCDLTEINDDLRTNFNTVMSEFSNARRMQNNLGASSFFRTTNTQERLDLDSAITASLDTPEPSAPLPDIGENAKRLNDIQYTGEVPEAFECALTREIMTDPVYDPKHPNIKFERTAIARALHNKKENPYTRTPLIKADLLFDEELKKEIDRFVAEKCQASLNLGGSRKSR